MENIIRKIGLAWFQLSEKTSWGAQRPHRSARVTSLVLLNGEYWTLSVMQKHIGVHV
jgi:hypothetical protein